MKKFIDFINEWSAVPFCIGMIFLCVWLDKQDWSDAWTKPDPVLKELNNQVEVKQ